MALSTYSELKTAIETWLARAGDTEISGNAADIVTLAEARLKRDLPLRVTWTSTTLTGTPGSRSIALPSNYVEPQSLFLTTFGVQTMLKPEIAGNIEYGATGGTPSAWAIAGSNIDLDVPCDQAHTFTFHYRKSLSLSDSSPTNDLLTQHPDAYLFACLFEAAMLIQDFEAAVAWNERAKITIESVADSDARSRSVATLSVDPAIVTPGGFNINEG
jgi:hypothetical protein